MKTFKLLSMVLIAIFISTSFTACSNDEEPVVPPVEDEYIDVPLKLSIDASIDITDEPISRAGNQNPVYAIEVQEINPNTSLTSSYAYGIFKSLDNITIKLKKNREYRIKAALYYDFFSKWEFCATDTKGYIYHNTYTDEFIYPQNGYFYGVGGWHIPNTEYSTTNLIEGDGYYGTIDKFSPSLNNICSLELKRVASAIDIRVEGLTEGKIQCILNCQHNNSELEYQLTSNNTTLSQIFIYQDLLIEKEAKIRLYVNYIPTVGEPIALISNAYLFTRNKRKKILIKLNNSGESENVNTGFNFTQEKVEFIDEEQIVHNCTIN